MKPKLLFGLLTILLLLASCSQENASPTPEEIGPTTASEPLTNAAETNIETVTPAGEEGTLRPASSPQPATPTANPPTPTSNPPTPISNPPTPGPVEPAEPVEQSVPIEITYWTPAQGEGPYYPVNKLDDRDNDLTAVEGSSGSPAGQIVEFGGVVYDAAGMPQPGIVVEIWQTDASGVYMHPGDAGTEQRDRNFQFYGEAVTGADGRYDFRTILPGRYEPRPRHIHVKVKLDGQELLTTQFYFADDPELAGESMFAQVGDEGQHLIITLEETQDEDGNLILMGQRDIVLNVELSRE